MVATALNDAESPKSENGSPATKRSLGVAACTAIVIGNMVGSGFYLSPALLAPYGNLAILAWVIMGAGAVCLGLTFAKLARLVPATGGPMPTRAWLAATSPDFSWHGLCGFQCGVRCQS